MEDVIQDALTLPENPTLNDFQNYIIELKKIRGFRDDKKNALIFLFNEMGELGRAIAKTFADPNNLTKDQYDNICFELADVFIFLLDIANQYNIDLEDAFRRKETINKLRRWEKHHRA